jgi:hypothetical protein
VSHGFDVYTPAAMNNTIQGICQLQAQTCVGNNAVYNGVSDCTQTLAAKPFGRSDETWGDNVVCRMIHVVLTQIRPEVSAIKCANRFYSDPVVGPLPACRSYGRWEVRRCGVQRRA